MLGLVVLLNAIPIIPFDNFPNASVEVHNESISLALILFSSLPHVELPLLISYIHSLLFLLTLVSSIVFRLRIS
jgi:hypothetical protein